MCKVGQLYKENKGGEYRGGSAYYIEKGLGIKWFATLFAIATIISTAIFLPGVQANSIADSVQSVGLYEQIWNDKFYKQVTGFTLAGLTLISLLMSLRKRFDIKWMGRIDGWRLFHITLGSLCAVLRDSL